MPSVLGEVKAAMVFTGLGMIIGSDPTLKGSRRLSGLANFDVIPSACRCNLRPKGAVAILESRCDLKCIRIL